MTAKKTRMLHWWILFKQGKSVGSFKLTQPALTLSPDNVCIRPEVSSTSSDTSAHVMLLSPKWSMDLDTASLEMKSSPVAIDYSYSTWNPMDSVWRKRTPLQNNPQ